MEKLLSSEKECREFVEENDLLLKDLVIEILDEDFMEKRFTENQKEILKDFYINDKMEEELAEERGVSQEDILKIRDDGVEEIMRFADFCNIHDILTEENLIEKLRQGEDELNEYIGFLKKQKGDEYIEELICYIPVVKGKGNVSAFKSELLNMGLSAKKISEDSRFYERYFFPKFTSWEKTLPYSRRKKMVILKKKKIYEFNG